MFIFRMRHVVYKKLTGIFLLFLIVSANPQEPTIPDDPKSISNCSDTACGAAYRLVRQANGSCFCVLKDCSHIEGCPLPPSVIEDCPSIEGCPSPPPEAKGP